MYSFPFSEKDSTAAAPAFLSMRTRRKETSSPEAMIAMDRGIIVKEEVQELGNNVVEIKPATQLDPLLHVPKQSA